MFRIEVQSGEAAPIGFSTDTADADFAGAVVTGKVRTGYGTEPIATVAGVLDEGSPVRGGYVPFVAPVLTGTKDAEFIAEIEIVKAGEIWSPKVEQFRISVKPR
jgi:hypothetical protein